MSASCTRDRDEIRIGLIHTTGVKSIKSSTENVLKMVRGRIEESGGLVVGGNKYPVTFVIREIDGNFPEQSVRAAKELINQENVVAILGPHGSIDAIPAGEVSEKSGIPLIAPVSTHPRTTAGRKYVFRTAFLSGFQASSMARFSLEDLGAVRAAVLFNVANPYSRKLAEVFRDTIKQEGGEVVSFESYVTGETDFTGQLERIKVSYPEVLFLPNFFDEVAPIVIKAKGMKIDVVLLGTNSWETKKMMDFPQPFEGAYMIDHVSLNAVTGKSREFVEEYQRRFGQFPESGTFLNFDAFGILLSAIQNAESFEPSAIRDALYDMGPYEGVGGRIDFVQSGDPKREAVILRFEKGKARLYKRILPHREEGPQA